MIQLIESRKEFYRREKQSITFENAISMSTGRQQQNDDILHAGSTSVLVLSTKYLD